MADACNLEWSFANTKSSTSVLAGIVSFEKISSEIMGTMPSATNRKCNVFSY